MNLKKTVRFTVETENNLTFLVVKSDDGINTCHKLDSADDIKLYQKRYEARGYEVQAVSK